MSEPLDPNAFTVNDMPEHVTPNHRVKTEAERPSLLGKLRGSSGQETTKRGSAPKLPREPKPTPAYREGMYVEPMEDFYTFLGMTLMPFKPTATMYLNMPETLRDSETNELIEGKTGARKCAEAWDAAAKKSLAVRRMLESFLVVSVWGALVTVHVPLFMALATKDDNENPLSGLEAMLRQHAGGDEK